MDENLSNDVQDKTADISGSGRKRLFEVAEPSDAIDGIAEADFFGPARASRGSTMHP
jgi:hypothetical protein